MRYLSPDFIKAYESADKDERKRMLRTILAAWDIEYQNLINCGVSPDTIWDVGNRQMGQINRYAHSIHCTASVP
jgi:hypothetical protein